MLSYFKKHCLPPKRKQACSAISLNGLHFGILELLLREKSNCNANARAQFITWFNQNSLLVLGGTDYMVNKHGWSIRLLLNTLIMQ